MSALKSLKDAFVSSVSFPQLVAVELEQPAVEFAVTLVLLSMISS